MFESKTASGALPADQLPLGQAVRNFWSRWLWSFFVLTALVALPIFLIRLLELGYGFVESPAWIRFKRLLRILLAPLHALADRIGE